MNKILGDYFEINYATFYGILFKNKRLENNAVSFLVSLNDDDNDDD